MESRIDAAGSLPFGATDVFAVGDDRHRAGLVDDEAAGELAVDVVDVHGDFRGLVLVLLEKPEQLGGAGRHGPERHVLSVDADGRLICAADRDHVMIAEDVAAGGLHQIMGFDVDAPALQAGASRSWHTW